MRYKILITLLTYLLFGGFRVMAQVVETPADTSAVVLPADTLATDSVPKKKNALDAPVDYQAKDSIVMTAGNWAYLFGEDRKSVV